MRVRVKICGITRPEDALAAAAAGADAIGLNFYPKSPRFVTSEQAAAVVAVCPPFLSIAGVFVDAPEREIHHITTKVKLTLLQFHGNEDAAVCESFGLRYIKAFNVSGPIDISALRAAHPKAAGLMLDASVPGVAGGSGRTFDWTLWPSDSGIPLILAGGLAPGNVAAAVRATRPYAVDVSTGVEQAPGRKDASLIRQFIDEVHRADSRQ